MSTLDRPTRRLASRTPCGFYLNKIEGAHTTIAWAEDISLRGMRLKRLGDPFTPMEALLGLQLELPDTPHTISLGARICYVDGRFFGVEFTHITRAHFAKLRAWLKERERTKTHRP